MTLRRTSGFWGWCAAALLTAAMAPGCVAPASVDARWAELAADDDSRLVYARARRVESTRNVWIGRAIAGIGAVLTTAAVLWWHDSEHSEDNGHDTAIIKRRAAYAGMVSGGILTAGVGYAGYHEEQADRWALLQAEEQFRLGGDDGAPKAKPKGGVAPPKKGDSIAAGSRGRLYIAHDEPLPKGAERFEVIRVRGATDPALAGVAGTLPVIRLPLLVMAERAGAPPTYAMGDKAVASVLAGAK